MTEPRRLLDDPTTPDELRRALVVSAATAPPIDKAAGLARLENAILMRAALSIVALLGGGLAVLAIVWLATRPEPSLPVSTPPPAPPVLAPELASPDEPSAPSTQPPAREPVLEPVILAPVPTEARERPRPPRVVVPPTTSEAREPEPGPDHEIALVGAARRSLASDPAAALAALEEADRTAPAGILLEEREGLRVLALAGLGRTEEARRRGTPWLRAHPSGTLSARVRAALDAVPRSSTTTSTPDAEERP